ATQTAIRDQYAAGAKQVNASMAVATFLCPSRRTTAAGPKIDFCGAYHGGIHNTTLSNYTNANGYNTVLDTYTTGPRAIGVSLSTLTSGAGTSNTLLLSHKVMRPGNYTAAVSQRDHGYAFTRFTAPTVSNGYDHDHMRWADSNGSGISRNKGYHRDDP